METNKRVNEVGSTKKRAKTVKSSAEQETSKSDARQGVISGIHLVNVRESASPDARVAGWVCKGDKVEIIGEENGFYKIMYAKHVGYIDCRFCMEVDQRAE